MGRPRTWTDDDLREAVASSPSLAEVVRRLRLQRGGAAYVTVRTRMEVLGLQLDGRRQAASAGDPTSNDGSVPPSTAPAGHSTRTWTEDELREAVGHARSLNEVFRLLGLSVGGSQWLVIRSLILDRGWSTEHWKRPLRGSSREPVGSGPFRERLDAVDVGAVIRDSRSRAEVIRSLGFSPGTTTYRALNEYLSRSGLDVSHFEASHDAMRRTPRRRYRTNLNDILVRGSTYTSIRTLKERLIDAGLVEPVCAECGIDSWNGQPLVLHLDHINGVRDDHRLENLRLLCPNCHSQTDTYCGRNQGRYVPRSVA